MKEVNPIDCAKIFFANALSKGQILNLSQIKIDVSDHEYVTYYQLIKKWYISISTLNFLPSDISNLEEIFIHSPTNIVLQKKENRTVIETDLTNDDLNIIGDLFMFKNKLEWNYKSPFVSFYTQIKNENVRISMIHSSCCENNHSKIFIRILNNQQLSLLSYTNSTDFISKLIHLKKNILIAGASGSGKTTFTNSLLSLIPKSEHVLIIEDTQELISPNINTTRLITDKANSKKSMNEYLSYALRMSPDRIILGEIRSAEAESSLLSLNTGLNGFISTIHSNSALEAVNRLALLFKIYSSKDLSYELVLKLITNNIDYVFFIKDKKIEEVIEVFGSQEEKVFFEKVEM